MLLPWVKLNYYVIQAKSPSLPRPAHPGTSGFLSLAVFPPQDPSYFAEKRRIDSPL
jgi:hypothetical protein